MVLACLLDRGEGPQGPQGAASQSPISLRVLGTTSLALKVAFTFQPGGRLAGPPPGAREERQHLRGAGER